MAAPLSSTLAIDIGTGSVRAALMDGAGRVVRIERQEHEQIVPRHGWSEQRPADWWDGVVAVVHRLLDRLGEEARSIGAVCACGQMHGTVLIDDDGRLTRETAPLWNDRRTMDFVGAFEESFEPATYLADCANPPTPAWPGFKLQWMQQEDPAAYDRAATVLMPKDYINFRLTGERAMDWSEASCSFLMDPRTNDWSERMLKRLGLDASRLAPIRMPQQVLGFITETAARVTGLRAGLPVVVGGGDFPVGLLGSGASRPGLASDMTGTSSIVTQIVETPILDLEVSNVGVADGIWGAFVLLESGGDAMRWARRALHGNAVDYEAVVRRAAEAPAGSNGLMFLPYLVGERLGAHRNSRAQFFGITPTHGMAHLHRAVMEGVAFSVARHKRIMEIASEHPIERVIASGGGAKTRLWLEIKASVYGVPILVPTEAECGIVGCAALAAVAMGRFSRVDEAASAFASYSEEVAPRAEWAERYARMLPVFESVYRNSQSQYDLLDALTEW